VGWNRAGFNNRTWAAGYLCEILFELEMLRNLTTILRLENFRPLPGENGRVGVDLAKMQKPDFILCDVMMPGLDGYGVIAALFRVMNPSHCSHSAPAYRCLL
jgi:hypothetical protein